MVMASISISKSNFLVRCTVGFASLGVHALSVLFSFLQITKMSFLKNYIKTMTSNKKIISHEILIVKNKTIS